MFCFSTNQKLVLIQGNNWGWKYIKSRKLHISMMQQGQRNKRLEAILPKRHSSCDDFLKFVTKCGVKSVLHRQSGLTIYRFANKKNRLFQSKVNDQLGVRCHAKVLMWVTTNLLVLQINKFMRSHMLIVPCYLARLKLVIGFQALKVLHAKYRFNRTLGCPACNTRTNWLKQGMVNRTYPYK